MTATASLKEWLIEQSAPVLLERRDGTISIRGGEQTWDLSVVRSPMAEAQCNQVDLMALLREDLDAGHAVLEELFEKTRAAIRSQNANAFLYHLVGASPADCTPMQYGGFLLELDRELVSQMKAIAPVVCFVEGEADLYLDSISDLGMDAVAIRSNQEDDPSLNCPVFSPMNSRFQLRSEGLDRKELMR